MGVGVLSGRCACRVVEFDVADEFVEAYNCHCSNCHALTGSVFKPWGEIEPEKMRLTRGAGCLVVQGDATGRHAVRCRSTSPCCIGRAMKARSEFRMGL